MQPVCRLVVGFLHCTRQSAFMYNIEAVVAQNLSLAQRVLHVVKAQKKTFQSQGASASYLKRHELLCL